LFCLQFVTNCITIFSLAFLPNYFGSATFVLNLHSFQFSTSPTHTSTAFISFSIVSNHLFFSLPLPLFFLSVHFHDHSYCFCFLLPQHMFKTSRIYFLSYCPLSTLYQSTSHILVSFSIFSCHFTYPSKHYHSHYFFMIFLQKILIIEIFMCIHSIMIIK
jgi:hypothetical protein